MEKKIFTAHEAAQYIRCDFKTMKRLSVNNWIKAYKIFNLIRFKKRSLDYFLKHHKEKLT